MTPERRQQLARIGAPAAFLLAVTVAVLLVRSATDGGDESVAPPTPAATRTTPATTRATRTLPQPAATATAPATQPYVIESGDTLETIAAEYDTTVERLVELNPGIDPVALRVGQRIQVPAG